jgi:signal transduction histidine kinase
VFGLLVLYRWLSLVPPLIFLLTPASPSHQIGALLAATFSNLLITLIPTRLNQLIRRWPALIAIDLIFVATLLAFTGGWRSPYYLFALSPLLASAFFFRLRGALITAGAFAPMFVVAALVAIQLGGPPPDELALSIALVGFFLVAGIFGYAATLLARVREAHDQLGRVHRELEIIHDLTISLQNAPEVREVQARVLDAVTQALGFRRAIVGLMDQAHMVLGDWQAQALAARGEPDNPVADQLPTDVYESIGPGGSPLAEAILGNQMRILSAGEPLTIDPAFDAALNLQGSVLIAPMVLREHPIGVLLVETDGAETSAANLDSLRAIASQAAVALGTTMLCIDRAQRLAIQEERMRFARELHDTLSQSLFGIVYALDGLGKLLPEQPDVVKVELEEVKQVAEEARAQIRQSILDIWPSALTAEIFQTDLRRFVGQFCRLDELRLDISLRGPFAALSPLQKRVLYRVAQEALTNVVKHAHARQAEVCLDVDDEQARLVVRDDGRGFDPVAAFARERDREHFGLKGIQERASALGGACMIESQPGGGTQVTVSIPIAAHVIEAAG